MLVAKPYIICLLFLAGTMASCVRDAKDIPPGFTEGPDFGMSADFGGQDINLAAGTNQWTMLPVVAHQDSLEVYTAIFSLNGCTSQCSPSWSFRFFQALPGQNSSAADFNHTIVPGEKELIPSDLETDSFDISLWTHPGLFMSGYSYWEDLFGPTTFMHQYETTLGYQDQLNVCFQSLAYTGCQYTQCIYFDPATEKPCIISVEPKLESPSYVSLNIRAEGTPPFQYQWFNEASTPSIVIPVQDSIAEIYAGVTVTDAYGNRAELAQTIRLQNGILDACYFPITLSSSVRSNAPSDVLANRVEIIYTDESGVVWRSSAGVQPDDSNVTIDEISAYGLSPSGQETTLVEATARVMLFNELTGESRLFQTTRLTLALSHP